MWMYEGRIRIFFFLKKLKLSRLGKANRFDFATCIISCIISTQVESRSNGRRRSFFWRSTTPWTTWTNHCTPIYSKTGVKIRTVARSRPRSTFRTSGPIIARCKTYTWTATKWHRTPSRKLCANGMRRKEEKKKKERNKKNSSSKTSLLHRSNNNSNYYRESIESHYHYS